MNVHPLDFVKAINTMNKIENSIDDAQKLMDNIFAAEDFVPKEISLETIKGVEFTNSVKFVECDDFVRATGLDAGYIEILFNPFILDHMISVSDILDIALEERRIIASPEEIAKIKEEFKHTYVRKINCSNECNSVLSQALSASTNLGNGVFMLPPDFGMKEKKAKSKPAKKKATKKVAKKATKKATKNPPPA